MDWSNDKVLLFLEFYEREVAIWDPSHKSHKDRDAVYDAWKRIEDDLSQATNEPASIKELKRKKDSLMASYRTCIAKIKQKSKSGTRADDVYKPNWYAFKKMAGFLICKDEARETINTEVLEFQVESSFNDEQYVDDVSINSDSCEGSELSSTDKRTKKRRNKSLETAALEKKMDEAFSILKSNQIANQKRTNRVKDDCDLFGELLATKLRKLNERDRDSVMNQIDNLIFKTKLSTKSSPFVFVEVDSESKCGKLYEHNYNY